MNLQESKGLQILENEMPFDFDTINANFVVIDFWHVECAFCIPALSKFTTLSEKYKCTGALNVEFITCSLNVGEHSKEESLTLLGDDTETLNLFALDKQQTKDFWNIRTVPHYVVLKRNTSTWDVLFSDNPNKTDIDAFLNNLLNF